MFTLHFLYLVLGISWMYAILDFTFLRVIFVAMGIGKYTSLMDPIGMMIVVRSTFLLNQVFMNCRIALSFQSHKSGLNLSCKHSPQGGDVRRKPLKAS